MEIQRQPAEGAKLAKGLAWVGIALGASEILAGLAMLVRASRRSRQHPKAIYGVTIARPPREVYAFYRHFARLPTFMDYLESVTETAAGHSHWVARLPGKGIVEWDAKIVEDLAGERIAWTSVPGSAVHTRGVVTFERTPGRDHTEVRVELELGVRGLHGAKLARWFTRPQIKGDLRRLKQVLETGEVLS